MPRLVPSVTRLGDLLPFGLLLRVINALVFGPNCIYFLSQVLYLRPKLVNLIIILLDWPNASTYLASFAGLETLTLHSQQDQGKSEQSFDECENKSLTSNHHNNSSIYTNDGQSGNQNNRPSMSTPMLYHSDSTLSSPKNNGEEPSGPKFVSYQDMPTFAPPFPPGLNILNDFHL